jgi:hypothetical protein
LGRPKGEVSKSVTTVSIPTYILDEARKAGLRISEIVTQALIDILDSPALMDERIAELRRDNEHDAAKIVELTKRDAIRDEEIRKLEKRRQLQELAPVLKKIRDLIGWDFDGDPAMALEMCKSEGLDNQFQDVSHKPLDLEALTGYIDYWNRKAPPPPD